FAVRGRPWAQGPQIAGTLIVLPDRLGHGLRIASGALSHFRQKPYDGSMLGFSFGSGVEH
ncbi:hypothetical protein ABTA81_19430, partial [Acinetobacter baumannii]